MSGLQRLHDAMAARVDQRQLPGIVLLVAQGDDVWVDAIGVTRFDGAEPMRRETLFRIASMTKPIIGAATLMLVEDGVLQLDEPVDKWLPELANPRVLRQPDAELNDTVPARRPITITITRQTRPGRFQVAMAGQVATAPIGSTIRTARSSGWP